jgi:metal-responsive CopG/Arc/MetJ family transcriptional regulator
MDSETTNISLTLEPDLLEKIDNRAKALDLNRSQYFRRLARADLDRENEPRSARQHERRKAA